MEQLFLRFSVDKLRQLESRIQHCLELLTTEQVWSRPSEENNSIGNLVLHLLGNVGQWIIASVQGVSSDRNRDAEFSAREGRSVDELKELLSKTVSDAVRTIETVAPERLTDVVTIQRFQVSILEAIYHAVEHFSMHTGQILYITKSVLQQDLGFYKHIGTPDHVDNTP